MGRRKWSWIELKKSGCKPSRWKSRQAEELAVLALSEPISKYLSQLERETATFESRIVPNENIMRDLNGNKFESFRKEHWLTECRDYAKASLANPECGDWTKEIATRFLADLDPSAKHGFLMDPVAVEAVQTMYAIWQTPQTSLNYLRLLAVVEFLGWKKPDGDLRFPDEHLLTLNKLDVDVIDKMITACNTAIAA